MIYLIKVEYKDETLLKIGYCKEKGLKKRKTQYLLHNPKCNFLLDIPGGTEEHEKRLHHKFREYLYPNYGREWFKECDEILNYFHTVTLSDLDKLEEIPKKIPKRLQYLITSGKLDEEFVKKFNSFTQFPDKMRLVCEVAKGMNPESKEYYEFLKNIPSSMAGYLHTLGPDKILGYGCQKSKVEAEFQKSYTLQENINPLVKEIFSKFFPREKYTKAQIKEMLKNIYQELGIKRTPKASDLEEWFEIKRSIITKDGKKSEGFEIIKRK